MSMTFVEYWYAQYFEVLVFFQFTSFKKSSTFKASSSSNDSLRLLKGFGSGGRYPLAGSGILSLGTASDAVEADGGRA